MNGYSIEGYFIREEVACLYCGERFEATAYLDEHPIEIECPKCHEKMVAEAFTYICVNETEDRKEE